MAVGLVGGYVEQGPNGGGRTFAFNAGSSSDRALLYIGWPPGGAVSGVTYAGAALTSLYSSGEYAGLYKTAPASGSNNIVVTHSSYTTLRSWVVCFDGADQTTPFGTIQYGGGTSTAPVTASITCPANGMVYGAAFHSYTQGTLTNTSGTLIGASVGSGLIHSYRTSSGTLEYSAGASVWWHSWAAAVTPASVAALLVPPATIQQAVARASRR